MVCLWEWDLFWFSVFVRSGWYYLWIHHLDQLFRLWRQNGHKRGFSSHQKHCKILQCSTADQKCQWLHKKHCTQKCLRFAIKKHNMITEAPEPIFSIRQRSLDKKIHYTLQALHENSLPIGNLRNPIIFLPEILFAPRNKQTLYLVSSRSHSSLQFPIRVLILYLLIGL